VSAHHIAKIISGGQTGADRGGLNAAIEAGVPHGGWCPRGRKAEDCVIPAEYHLVEHDSADYVARTEANVIDSHSTVVFTFGKPMGGSKKTVAFAEKHQRPCLCLDLATMTNEGAARAVLEWLSSGGLMCDAIPVPPPNPVLNVAGSRESKAPGIQQRVKAVMLMVLKPPFYPLGSE
jgi:hypothetical protein